MTMFQRIQHVIAPPGTTRAEIPRLAREAVRVWRQQGFGAMWMLTRQTVQAHWRGFIAYRVRGLRPYSYTDWIRDHEPDADALAQQRQEAVAFAYQPRFSVITPVYNPPPDILRETVQSVLEQTYPHWELHLVDGASDRPGVRAVLDELAAQDARIHVMHLPENRGISGNSNAALDGVRGEFVALLDHDDLVAPNLLYAVTDCLNRALVENADSAETDATQSGEPPLDIIYYDEDKISADGAERRAPWFKPQWSPEMMFGTNLLMHGVFRRTLLQQVGGFDPAMDGAQDWDVALRCVEVTDRIAHIPQVLYHWRQIEGSAALDANAKPWAFAAQKRCLTAHLARTGHPGAHVDFPRLGVARILWPDITARVSIIIPNKDKPALIRACLESIFAKTTHPNYEIVLVDTGSRNAETLAFYDTLRGNERVKFVDYAGRFNFSRACNLGAQHATGDLLLFLNNDTEVLEPTWLEEMAGWALRPPIGVVGNKLVRPDDTIQHAGLVMGLIGHGSHVFDGGHEGDYGVFGSPETYRNYLSMTGACMMLRRDVFEGLAGFDEVYEIGFSDMDLCLRAVYAGYRNVYTPFARVLHHEGGSRGLYLPPADVLRATYQMWPVIAPGDPYFNPNLSCANRIPSLAHPDEPLGDVRLLHILQHFGLVPWSTPTNGTHESVARNALAPPPDSGLADDPAALPEPPLWPDCLQPQQRPADQTVDQTADQTGKPRLLIISHDLSLSGAPLVLFMLARELMRRGYPIRVAAPLDGPLRQRYADAGIAISVVPGLLNDSRVDMQVVSHGYDLVIVNSIVSWKMVHAARAFNLPSILCIHEPKFGLAFVHQQRGAADALKVADRIVFASQATADLYDDYTDPVQRVTVRNGLDPALLQPEPDGAYGALPLRADKINIVTVGTIEPRKGQDVLLQSVRDLPPAVRSQVECFLIGRILDSADRRYVRALRKAVNARSNLHLVGELQHQQLMRYLAAADICVMPSHDDVISVAVVEAMYHGLPVISTEVSGISEVIDDGLNGYLIPVGDHAELTRRLERLCTDPDLRQLMGARARKTFDEQLTAERFGAEFASVIQACMDMVHVDQGRAYCVVRSRSRRK